jgi:hypothetical protein
MLTQVDHRITPPLIGVAFFAVDRDGTKVRSIAQKQIAEFSLTDASCVRQHCIEDRLKLTGRA